MTPPAPARQPDDTSAAAAAAGGAAIGGAAGILPAAAADKLIVSTGQAATEAAKKAAEAAIIAGVIAWLARSRKEAPQRIYDTMRTAYPAEPEDELRKLAREEDDRESEFRRKMLLRLKRDLPRALSSDDPRVRQQQVMATLDRERRYVEMREHAMAERALGAVERMTIKRVSPLGAYWALGEGVKRHTLDCLVLAGQFWPWEFLDVVAPPLHHGCACYLIALRDATASGLMTEDQIPDTKDAVARGTKLYERAKALEHAARPDEIATYLALVESDFEGKHARDRRGRFAHMYRLLPQAIREQVREGGMVPNPATGNPMHVWDNLPEAQRYQGIVNGLEPHDIWEIDKTALGKLKRDPWFKQTRHDWGDNPGAWQSDVKRVAPEHIRLVGPEELQEASNYDLRYPKGTAKAGQFRPRDRYDPGIRKTVHKALRDLIPDVPRSPVQRRAAHAGEWHWVAGRRVFVPEHRRFDRRFGAHRYISPPGSTIVYRDGVAIHDEPPADKARAALSLAGKPSPSVASLAPEPIAPSPSPVAAAPSGYLRADKPWESMDAFYADSHALADELGQQFHASVIHGSMHVNPESYDHSGLEDWEGNITFGPDLQTNVESEAARIARGEPAQPHDLEQTYWTYQSQGHEVSHTVNDAPAPAYTMPGGQVLEEGLAEEAAHVIARENLARHGRQDVLDYVEASPHTPTANGVYIGYRRAIGAAFDRMGVPSDERERVVMHLKFQTDPAARVQEMASLSRQYRPKDPVSEAEITDILLRHYPDYDTQGFMAHPFEPVIPRPVHAIDGKSSPGEPPVTSALAQAVALVSAEEKERIDRKMTLGKAPVVEGDRATVMNYLRQRYGYAVTGKGITKRNEKVPTYEHASVNTEGFDEWGVKAPDGSWYIEPSPWSSEKSSRIDALEANLMHGLPQSGKKHVGYRVSLTQKGTGNKLVTTTEFDKDGEEVVASVKFTAVADKRRERIVGRTPTTQAEAIADMLGRADELARKHGVATDVHSINFNYAKKTDHNADHTWDGRLRFGTGVLPGLQGMWKARAEERTMTELEARQAWQSYEVAQHEINHGLNPLQRGEYNGWGRALMEGMNEEIAPLMAADWLKSQGELEPLSWAKGNQADSAVTGTYQGFRSALGTLLDKAGIVTRQQRRDALMHMWFNLPDTTARRDWLAQKIADHKGWEMEGARLEVEATLGDANERYRLYESGFKPLVGVDFSDVPDPPPMSVRRADGAEFTVGDKVQFRDYDEAHTWKSATIVAIDPAVVQEPDLFAGSDVLTVRVDGETEEGERPGTKVPRVTTATLSHVRTAPLHTADGKDVFEGDGIYASYLVGTTGHTTARMPATIVWIDHASPFGTRARLRFEDGHEANLVAKLIFASPEGVDKPSPGARAESYVPGGSLTPEMVEQLRSEGFYSLRDAAREGIAGDVLDSTRFTGSDDPPGEKVDIATKAIKADDPIVVYRAMPTTASPDLRAGQFVTTSRKYAEWHARKRTEGEFGLGPAVVRKFEARPSELQTDGVTPHDFIYVPPGKASPGAPVTRSDAEAWMKGAPWSGFMYHGTDAPGVTSINGEGVNTPVFFTTGREDEARGWAGEKGGAQVVPVAVRFDKPLVLTNDEGKYPPGLSWGDFEVGSGPGSPYDRARAAGYDGVVAPEGTLREDDTWAVALTPKAIRVVSPGKASPGVAVEEEHGIWETPLDTYTGPYPSVGGDDPWNAPESVAYRARRDEWNAEMARAVSFGKITPQAAYKLGYTLEQPDDWAPLPETLFHATTAKDAVLASGQLRSRAALGMDRTVGLGGGADDTVSFTSDRETAQQIADSMREAHDVVTGAVSIADLIQRARTGSDAKRPYLSDLTGYMGGDASAGLQRLAADQTIQRAPGYQGWIAADLPEGWSPVETMGHWTDAAGVERYNYAQRPMTPDEIANARMDFFKNYLAFRENAGGSLNPLFWGTDAVGVRDMDPSQIAVVEVHPVTPRAMGLKLGAGGLAEWRVKSPDVVSLDGVLREASFDSVKHPRDRRGRWVKGLALRRARSDDADAEHERRYHDMLKEALTSTGPNYKLNVEVGTADRIHGERIEDVLRDAKFKRIENDTAVFDVSGKEQAVGLDKIIGLAEGTRDLLPPPVISPEVAKIANYSDAETMLAQRGVEAHLAPPPHKRLPAVFYQQITQAVYDAQDRYSSLREGDLRLKGVAISTDIEHPTYNPDDNALWATTGPDPRTTRMLWPRFDLDDMGEPHLTGWHDPKESGEWIVLNGNYHYEGKGLNYTAEYGDVAVADQTPYGRMMHELGHAAHAASGLMYDWGITDDTYISAGHRTASILDEAGMSPEVGGHLSPYGASSQNEMWAEVFATLNVPGATEATGPFVMPHIKKMRDLANARSKVKVL